MTVRDPRTQKGTPPAGTSEVTSLTNPITIKATETMTRIVVVQIYPMGTGGNSSSVSSISGLKTSFFSKLNVPSL
jgi:hypothetical protein